MPVSVNEVLRHFPDSRVEHKRNGVEIITRHCPLHALGMGREHGDVQWKTYINPRIGSLKCFVCHPPGEFARLADVLPRHRLSAPPAGQEPVVHRPPVADLPNVNLISDLPEEHPGRAYLAGRGISAEVADACSIYWKPLGQPCWFKDGEPKFDKLAGLIIPMRSGGTLMAWQFGPVPRVDFLPKYINAPHSKMGDALFNYDNVAHQSKVCVILEGLFDTLKVPHVGVGLFGNSITDGKRRLLASGGFREIILCLDPDAGGMGNKDRVSSMIHKLSGCAPIVRPHFLPQDGRDPGDYSMEELRGALGV